MVFCKIGLTNTLNMKKSNGVIFLLASIAFGISSQHKLRKTKSSYSKDTLKRKIKQQLNLRKVKQILCLRH
jgi:hypothetical protein